MLASAARWAGNRVVAVVLSGALDDGAVGAALVAQAGGRVVVEQPAEAIFGSMPRAALAAAPGAVAVPASGLAAAVIEMTGATIGELPAGSEGQVRPDMDMAHSDDPQFLAATESSLTRLTCPDCGGVLARIELPRIGYYRCHVGHQYGPETLQRAQAEVAEAKLWSAVAALEEHAVLARDLAEQCMGHADGVPDGRDDADGYLRTAQRSTALAESVRGQLRSAGNAGEPGTTEP
jgi:two-component system chemotaxis response regulator CheB